MYFYQQTIQWFPSHFIYQTIDYFRYCNYVSNETLPQNLAGYLRIPAKVIFIVNIPHYGNNKRVQTDIPNNGPLDFILLSLSILWYYSNGYSPSLSALKDLVDLSTVVWNWLPLWDFHWTVVLWHMFVRYFSFILVVINIDYVVFIKNNKVKMSWSALISILC